MKLRIVSVGTKAPAWVRTGFAEYTKRMPNEMPVELVEIPAPKHGGDKAKHMQSEAAKMLAAIGSDDWVVALDEKGKRISSVQLAGKLDQWRMDSTNVVFLVGGADGLGKDVRRRANETVSLSELTLPHYMVRVILAEALYRAWTIHVGHPYHRG